MEELITHRRVLATAVLLIAAGWLLLSGCGPNLKQSLTETATSFYCEVANGNNPYGQFNAAPLWPELPIDAPQIVTAKATSVAEGTVKGEWIVSAELEVSTGENKIVLDEETTWRWVNRKWHLDRVSTAGAEFAGWSDSYETGAGLLAFQQDGQIWLIDTSSGKMAHIANPEETGEHADRPLYIDEWSPDGSGLLFYTESAVYWYRPATGQAAKVADVGNYGGVTWSPDGKYGLLDWGTDVIRTLEVFDVAGGKVIGRLAAYTAMWSPDGEIIIARPDPVTPEWPAGDGSSFSVARAMIKNISGKPAVLTETLVPGTSTAMFTPDGYGRDGTLYYTQTELRNGAEVVSWWKWDAEAKQGVRQWSRPALDAPETPPTVQVPSRLGGPRSARVEVSEDGKWGVFTATEGDAGDGIYLIDLTAPSAWQRIAAGTSPRWAVRK